MEPRSGGGPRGNGRPADACLLDIDGTVYEKGRAIPGAAEALEALHGAGIPFRFVTNTTRRPRSAIVQQLAEVGLAISEEDCFTAPLAAVRYLREQGARRVLALLQEATLEEFAELEHDPLSPEFVVVGDLGEGWNFQNLNGAFRALMAGAGLLAVQRNRYWRVADGLALDAGAFVAALEYASGQQATLVGKPSPAFFRQAAASLEVPVERIVMVGDDMEADVVGAKECGLQAVAVRTGKFDAADPEDVERADAVLASVAELPAWVGL
jgi:phospholysine phosphohistidine inorganic pyrophosphate phosphatase